jgi:NAD(P)H-hydrate epimerase
MNASWGPIVGVDIPSGLDTDSGAPLGVAIQAGMTVALAYPKLGEVIYPGLSYVGDLAVADIGIDCRAVEEVSPYIELLEREGIRRLVPAREPDTHKGTYGHLLVMAGSRGKTGAAILASRAAMRTGAGLVTLAAPRSLNDIFASSLVEVMTEPLRDNAAEEMEPLGEEDWRRLLERKNSLLFGPGIGVLIRRGAHPLVAAKSRSPWVMMRTASIIWRWNGSIAGAKTPPILTPHLRDGALSP